MKFVVFSCVFVIFFQPIATGGCDGGVYGDGDDYISKYYLTEDVCKDRGICEGEYHWNKGCTVIGSDSWQMECKKGKLMGSECKGNEECKNCGKEEEWGGCNTPSAFSMAFRVEKGCDPDITGQLIFALGVLLVFAGIILCCCCCCCCFLIPIGCVLMGVGCCIIYC